MKIDAAGEMAAEPASPGPDASGQRELHLILHVLATLDSTAALAILRRAAATYFPNVSKLSKRQQEVLDLLCEGMSNRAVGKRLLISVKTVETHRAQIMKRVGVHSMCDLVRIAAYRGRLP